MLTKFNQSKVSTWRRLQLLTVAAVIIISSYVAFLPSARANGFPSSQDTYSFTGSGGTKGGSNSMNVVRTNGDNVPAIIFVHGGGWRTDGGTFGPDFQQRAAARGYTSFRLNYTLGANGIYSQLNEVMGAIKFIRDNAAKYNIDKNRIAIWGDSAGGSLVTRAAATGKSGAAVAVGWSAPTNAFRDIFNSYQSFLIGMDHGTCIDTSFIDPFLEIMPLFELLEDPAQQLQAIVAGIERGEMPTPDQVIALNNSALNAAGLTLAQLPSTFDKLEPALNEWGITFEKSSLLDVAEEIKKIAQENSTTTAKPDNKDKSEKKPLTEKQLVNKLKTMTPEEREQVAEAAVYLSETAAKDDLTPEQREMIGIIQQGLDDIVQASVDVIKDSMNEVKKQVSDELDSIEFISGVNVQGDMVTKKIIECLENFIATSPALFASPRTPPMFLANAQSEYLVNPADAREMTDKLRSMGIRSEYLILPGDNHMGYDERAEGPSFDFVASILHPTPATAPAANAPTANAPVSDNPEEVNKALEICQSKLHMVSLAPNLQDAQHKFLEGCLTGYLRGAIGVCTGVKVTGPNSQTYPESASNWSDACAEGMRAK